MARIDELTSGVLQQGLNAGRFVGFGMIRLGRAGVGINPTLAENIQHFRSGTGLGATSPQRATPNMFAVGDTAGVQFIASSGGAVLETRFVTVLQVYYDSSNRWNIVVDLNPGNSDADIPAGTHNSRYQFITGMNLGAGEVTSTRNFNFDAGLTITNFRNVPFLGTDENGVVVAGMGGAFIYEQNVFPGDTDSSLSGTDADGREPTQGDFWINPSTLSVSAPGTAVYAPVIRVAPAVPAGSPANFVAYGGGPNVAIDASGIGIYNIEISHNRNSQVSPALGVASNPLVLAWRSGDAGAWTELSATVDSSPNGNQQRVRVANSIPFADYAAIPDGAQIGYRVSTRPGAVTEFEAGTYIYNGTEWRLLNRDTSTAALSDSYVTGGSTRINLAAGDVELVLNRNGGLGEATPIDLNVAPAYLQLPGDLTKTLPEHQPPVDIGEVGEVLRVVSVGGSHPGRGLAWDTVSSTISVTQEGDSAITGIDNVIFDNRHFDIRDLGSGDVEVVLTASAAGGGAGFQDEGAAVESPNPDTVEVGNGLTLTATNVGMVGETAKIDALDVTIIGSSGSANLNQLNVYSAPAIPPTFAYTFPDIMSSGSSPVRLIHSGDFLIMRNTNPTQAVTVLHSSRGVTHRINNVEEDLVIDPGEVITLVYSEDGNRTGESAETWIITHRTGAANVARWYTHTQTMAENSWTVNHNLGNTRPVITVYDDSGEVIIPDSITITNENSLAISFPGTTTVAGAVTIIG